MNSQVSSSQHRILSNKQIVLLFHGLSLGLYPSVMAYFNLCKQSMGHCHYGLCEWIIKTNAQLIADSVSMVILWRYWVIFRRQIPAKSNSHGSMGRPFLCAFYWSASCNLHANTKHGRNAVVKFSFFYVGPEEMLLSRLKSLGPYDFFQK